MRLRQYKAIASLRKFDEHGDWQYVKMLPRSLFLFAFRRPRFEDWIDCYWYRPNR